MGALRSCISRFDETIDISKAEMSEFPSFVGCHIGGMAHVLTGFLASADIGPYLAFASRDNAAALNLYIPTTALSGITASSFSEVVSTLSLQGEGFTIPVSVLIVGRGHPDSVAGVSSLQAVIQDENALREFIVHPGAAEVLDLVAGSGCETFFVGDRMIATHLGLEVARSVWTDGRLGLEVGVGRNDRMARTWLTDSRTQSEQLAETIQVVNRHRLGSLKFHPLARLSVARWMRLAIRKNPGLISARQLIPVELIRKGNWPTRGLWSLKTGSEVTDEDALMYKGFDPSFEEDDMCFAIATDHHGGLHVVGISGGVDLGAVPKLYEVARCLADEGRSIDGSILVMQERNRIVPIERLVNLAGFGLRSAILLPTWKIFDSK